MKILERFYFGKYKGKTLSYVLNIDPKYIEWCIDNIKEFKLTKSVLKQLYINLSYE